MDQITVSQRYLYKQFNSGAHNVHNKIASEIKSDINPNQDPVQLKYFDLKKSIKIDYANFLKEHKESIERIRNRCTPNISGRIAILEDWQNTYFLSHNCATKNKEADEIRDLSAQIEQIQNSAKEQGLRLDSELIMLFSHIRVIEEFLTSLPTSLAISLHSTNKKVELIDLFKEIERIEDRIPLAKTQESTSSIIATTKAFIAASDDINPLLQEYNCPGPSSDHGAVAGLSAAFFDVIGSAFAKTTPAGRHIEMKINKLSLLIKLDLFLATYNRFDIPRSLERRIDNILQEARNFSFTSKTATKSYLIKETLIHKHDEIKSSKSQENILKQSRNGKIDLDKENTAQVKNILPISNGSHNFLIKIINLEAKLTDFAKNGKNHDEIKDLIDSLISQHKLEDPQNINSAKYGKDNQMNIYDYLWKILNKYQYQYCQRGEGSLRRVYYTPIEALTKHNPQLLEDLVYNLSDLKGINNFNEHNKMSMDANNEVIVEEERVRHYKFLYNYLYNLLENANKDNVIEVMHKVILVIKGSKLNQTQKAHLYHDLLDLRLNPDHGNLFKVANEKRTEALIKKGVISSCRYGAHNISTIEAITAGDAILANELRWPVFTALNKVSESTFYKTYIERAHTLNTILQLRELAYKNFFQLTNENTNHNEADTVQVNINSLLNISKSLPHQLIENVISKSDNQYIYNKLTAITEQDGKKLPLFYHLILNKDHASKPEDVLQQRKEAVINFSNLAQKYDPIFINALTIPSSNQEKTFYNCDCEPTDFECVANLSFESANNPLMVLVWIIGFAVQDSDPERSWAKMQIIANILNSANDSRSVLFGKFSPSVAKTFLVEMLITNILGIGYGAAYALLPLIALPVLCFINLTRFAGSNSKTINILLGKLTNSNKKIAANALLEFMNKNNNEAHKNPNNHDLDYYSQLNKDLEKRKLEKHQPQFEKDKVKQKTKLDPSTTSFSSKYTTNTEQINLTEENNSLNLEREAESIIVRINQKYPIDDHKSMLINKPIEILAWALHLDKSTTQEQLLRKLILMSYVINIYECSNEDRIKILAHILYALRFGVIAVKLRQPRSQITDQFFDRKTLINSVMTLGPYTASQFISDQTLGAITGLAVDATGSFTTSLIGNKMPTALTKGYTSIMKNLKNQLLKYAKIEFGCLRNDRLEAFAYGALGAHRHTLGFGETNSQKKLRNHLKRIEK